MIRRMLVLLLLSGMAFAQGQPAPQAPNGPLFKQGRLGGNSMGAYGRRYALMHGTVIGMDLPGGKFWTNTELAQKIGLTTDQTRQMEKIFQDTRLQLIDKVAAVEKAEVQLDPMLQADHPDENSVLAQIDKIAQARADLEKTNARMMLGIRQAMSADQWSKLKALAPAGIQPRRAFGPGGGNGPGPRGLGGPGGPPPSPQPPE